MNGKLRAGCFSISDAAKLSGLKKPMVDYLCRTGTLVPTGTCSLPGRGNPRSYTFGDIVMLRAIAKLLRRGVSVLRLRRALKQLRSHHAEITRSSLPGRFLVTDGEVVYFRNGTNPLENLNAGGQLAFAFVLELGHVREEVCRNERRFAVVGEKS